MNLICRALCLCIACLELTRGAETIYVSSFYDGTVVRVGADGTKTTLAKDLGYPLGIATDGAGLIYVASGITNRIRVLDANGIVSALDTAPVRAGYTAMAFDASGRLFIANQDSSGVVVMSASGSGQFYAGGLSSPFGLAFDARGTLHVAHIDNRRHSGVVSQILPDHTVKAIAPDLASPAGIAFDKDGNLYVAERQQSRVLKIAPDGNRTVHASGLNDPMGLAFGGNGRLLVAEHGSGTVTEIAANGEHIPRVNGLQGPTYLAVTDDNSTSLSIASMQSSSQVTRLMMRGSPLSYHEILHSQDLVVWRSLGWYQVIGGNSLEVVFPSLDGASREFYALRQR